MKHPQILEREGQPDIAYVYTPADISAMSTLPPVIFLGGFKSDMAGTKALYLEEQCLKRGQAFLRLDYSGHGVSGGKFADGTIGAWKDDALAVIDHLGLRGAILVGSSMGGWISLVITIQRPEIAKAFVGIAAAPDFTDDMWFNRLNDAQRSEITQNGLIAIPSGYSEDPYIITKALIENGRENFVLDKTHPVRIPMILLQGMKDADVHWDVPEDIKAAFPAADVKIILIEDGDHRLSRPQDLELLDKKVRQLSGL